MLPRHGADCLDEPTRVCRPARDGRYVYRVGVVSDYNEHADSLDLMLLSKPVSVQAR